MRRLIALSAFAAFTIANSAAPPPSTSGSWVSQTDVTDWPMCTDARGLVFCELKSGGRIRQMVCP